MLHQANMIFIIVFILLAIASFISYILAKKYGKDNATISNLTARINAWWVMTGILFLAFLFGRIGVTVLFFLLSLLALREFMAVIYRHQSPDFPMVGCVYLLLVLQYYFVFSQWYGMFAILIPVYGFVLLPIISSLSGNTEHFLARTAQIQWMSMSCIYCIAHVPALLFLELDGVPNENNILLIIFMIATVQFSDVLQYIWGKLIGGAKIMPKLSPSKTISGTVGGILSATLIATLLAPITPFSHAQAAQIGFTICVMGFLGGLVMSAIKREHGVKDWGNIIKGHGGVLDRLDSVCFSAPIFFHVVRYFWNG